MEPKQNVFDTMLQERNCKILQGILKFAWENDLAFEAQNKTLDKNSENLSKIVLENFLSNEIKNNSKQTESETEILNAKFNYTGEIVNISQKLCNKCKSRGYVVTNMCQACTGKYCQRACKFDAVYFDENSKSHIDPEKCKSCSACSRACPYGAVISLRRPCQLACKLGAISAEEKEVPIIDPTKCISCGACVRNCPFGAILDYSYLIDFINIIKESKNNTNYKVYALIAPSIVSQFEYAKFGQLVEGLLKLGFYKVLETAVGADKTALEESEELAKSDKLLLSSCCPAFVLQIEKHFPKFSCNISNTKTPMHMIATEVKKRDKNAKCVFIGPCIAKKIEFRKKSVAPYVESVLTYEDLEALFESVQIDLRHQSESKMSSSSCFGQVFARSGGLTEAVEEGLKENENLNFFFKSAVCSGCDECKVNLLKLSKDPSSYNFVEGMACIGGCIGGPACLKHANKHKKDVDDYGGYSEIKLMKDSVFDL